MPDSYLVIGGSGFLGRHIVEALLARGEPSVAVLDIVQRHFDEKVTFYSGDITDEAQVSDAIRKSSATCIIHTASPHSEAPPEVLIKVNIQGTQSVIAAAVANHVPKLVYTSSAGVVFNRSNIIDVDERLDYPDGLDAYNQTKADAEKLVLAANGQGGLATVSLRPAGIFGPGDRQLLPSLANALKRGQTKIQVGDNTNIFDWTYVANVVKAHLIAADRLSLNSAPLDTELLTASLTPINLTQGPRRIPTSTAHPLGPNLNPTQEELSAAADFDDLDTVQPRPVLRTKFDALSSYAVANDYETSPLVVAGQAFFITGGEPLYFWDFFRAFWKEMGDDTDPKKVWTLGKTIGLVLGTLSEYYGQLVGKKDVTFTRYRVHYLCNTRWHNIEKARRVLGYYPDVGVEEGIKRTVEWWRTEGKAAA